MQAPLSFIQNKECRFSRTVLSFLLMSTAYSGVAWSGPTGCTGSGTTYTCQGNQSGGIDVGVASNPPASAETITLNNLTPLSDGGPYTGAFDWTSTLAGSTTLRLNLNLSGIEQSRSSSAPNVRLSAVSKKDNVPGPALQVQIRDGQIRNTGGDLVSLSSQGANGNIGSSGKSGSKPSNGGTGGTGGAGGAIHLVAGSSSESLIFTGTGEGRGVRSVSQGGNGGLGGNGGSSQGVQTSGGNGGVGGAGGTISLLTDGTTILSGSAALIAISSGGQGGDGNDARNKDAAGGKGRGGTGGVGGRGGAIFLDGDANGGSSVSPWSITSSAAYGIQLLSNGGVGGTGGKRERGGGGVGGAGGHGGKITTASGARQITSSGTAAFYAKSTGGKGGVQGGATASAPAGAGAAGGDGGLIQLGGRWAIVGSGTATTGIHAISQGGEGTDSTSESDDSRVKSGGSGGSGGALYLYSNESNTLRTTGIGVILQSFGGNAGGGNSGASAGNGGEITIGRNASGAVANGSWNINTTGNSTGGLLARSVGGVGGPGFESDGDPGYSGGAGGAGGNITLVEQSQYVITTSGSKAPGIRLLSQGGAGGDGGPSEDGQDDIDGQGGQAGAGGVITVDGDLDITTTGPGSHGLVAASIGGNADTKTKTRGKPGAGGNVAVTLGGTGITTSGQAAHGLYLQSSAGTSGSGAVASGTVTAKINADVTASGESSYGVFATATSFGGATPGHITIDVGAEATVKAAGAAIWMASTGPMTVTNNGTIEAVQGASGVAIEYVNGGFPTLNNNGLIVGKVLNPKPGTTRGQVFNSGSGTIYTARVDADVLNSGLFRGYSGGTVVSGDYVQTADGETRVASDALSSAPLVISRDAEISGGVGLDLSGSDYLNMLEQRARTLRVITAGGAISLGADAAAVGPVLAQPRLSQGSGGAVHLSYNVDFANDTIKARTNNNQDDLVDRIEAAYQSGDLLTFVSDEAVVLAAIEDIDDFNAAANSLSGEIYANTQLAALSTAQMFSDTLLSCSEREGTYRFISQDQCTWLHLGASRLSQNANADSSGYSQTTYTVSGGGQFELRPGTHLGFALAYQDVSLDMAAATSDSATYRLGVMAKHQIGPALFSAALSGGTSQFDTTRTPVTGGLASASQDVTTYSGALRGEYTMTRGTWTIVPQLDLGIDHVDADGFDETGSSKLTLNGTGSSKNYLRLRPAIEFGREQTGSASTLYRTTFTVGLTQYLTDIAPGVTTNFDFVPDDPSFVSIARLDRTSVDLGARFEIFALDKVSVTGSVAAKVSKNTHTVGAAFRAQYRF